MMMLMLMTMLMMMLMTMLMMVTWKPVAEVISGQRPWIAVRMEADTSKEGRTCVEEVSFVIIIILVIIIFMIMINIIIIRMCRKTNMVEAVLGGSQREEGGRVALHD